MMRTLFTGATGLTNFQAKIDVISNNISNVNTTGYNAQRMQFGDIMDQMITASAAPTDFKGSRNSIQAPHGSTIASIDNLISQGGMQLTTNPYDMAIQGEGWFAMFDGEQMHYTRAGTFGVDGDEFLVDPGTGFFVMGWAPEIVDDVPTIVPGGDLGSLSPTKIEQTISATATTEMTFAGNLNSDENTFAKLKAGREIFDSEGNAYFLNVVFSKNEVFDMDNDGADGIPANMGRRHNSEILGTGDLVTFDFLLANAPALPDSISVRVNSQPTTAYTLLTDPGGAITGISFNTAPGLGDLIAVDYSEQLSTDDDGTTDGTATSWTYRVEVLPSTGGVSSPDMDALRLGSQLPGPQEAAADAVIPDLNGSGVVVFDNATGMINKALSFVYNNVDPNTRLPVFSTNDYDEATDSYISPVSIQSDDPAVGLFDIILNIDEVSQFSEQTTVEASTQNGYGAGELVDYYTDSNGLLTGEYSNGKTKVLGQIPLARFINQGGLHRTGNTSFIVSNNSGTPSLGMAGDDGRGTIHTNFLEMSNVDLAREFSELIIAQRAFQMNSSSIRTADKFLERAVNLKT